MKISQFSTALALGLLEPAIASPIGPHLEARAPTVFLCGDSTMVATGAGDGQTAGWGAYLQQYLTGITVSNQAIAGRSARSYWDEGRFASVAASAKSGDIVVIEFGHNDGSSPESNDNGRSDCPGSGEETCISDVTGATVYTFVFYEIQAAKLMLAKGATVILSSQTPNNPWETGSFVWSPPRFVGYETVAKDALASSSVTLVDHFQAVDNAYEKLGNSATNALYPVDHTHTSPAGANLVAEAFVQAIHTSMNGTTSLAPYVISNPPVVY